MGIAASGINMKETGKNIKNLRENMGLSVTEMRDLVGCAAVQSIYQWENGVSLPSIDNLLVLSQVYQTPIKKIIVPNS